MNDDTDIYTAFLLKENKEIKIENAKLKQELEKVKLQNIRFYNYNIELKKELSESNAMNKILDKAFKKACKDIFCDCCPLCDRVTDKCKDAPNANCPETIIEHYLKEARRIK